MKCRLLNYDGPIPGNYPYVQTEGIHRDFSALPIIESQAQTVSEFRRGNSLPRASVRECLEDVDHYNAQRLGCHRSWTVAIDAQTGARTVALNPTHPIMAPPCNGCGAQLMTV